MTTDDAWRLLSKAATVVALLVPALAFVAAMALGASWAIHVGGGVAFIALIILGAVLIKGTPPEGLWATGVTLALVLVGAVLGIWLYRLLAPTEIPACQPTKAELYSDSSGAMYLKFGETNDFGRLSEWEVAATGTSPTEVRVVGMNCHWPHEACPVYLLDGDAEFLWEGHGRRGSAILVSADAQLDVRARVSRAKKLRSTANDIHASDRSHVSERLDYWPWQDRSRDGDRIAHWSASDKQLVRWASVGSHDIACDYLMMADELVEYYVASSNRDDAWDGQGKAICGSVAAELQFVAGQ